MPKKKNRVQQSSSPETGSRKRLLIPAFLLILGGASFAVSRISTTPERSPVENTADGTRDRTRETLSPPSPERTLELEGFRFSFDARFNPEEYSQLSELIKKSIPEILRFIPRVENVGKGIRVLKTHNRVSSANYQEGVLYINPNSTDGLKVHEIIHLIRGEFDTWYGLLEEGTAIAIADLVCERLGLQKWNVIQSMQVNGNLAARLSVDPATQYDGNPGLHALRYYYAQRVWREFEERHPGFMMKLHQRYFGFLKAHKNETDLNQAALRGILESIDKPLTDEMYARHSIMTFSPGTGKERIVYGYYSKIFTGKTQEYVIFQFAERDRTNGREAWGRGIPVEYVIHDLDRNVQSRTHRLTTNGKGEAVLNFRDARTGNWVMVDGMPRSRNFRVYLKGPGVQERFDFTCE